MNDKRDPNQLDLNLEDGVRAGTETPSVARVTMTSSPLRLAYSSDVRAADTAADKWVRQVLSSVKFF